MEYEKLNKESKATIELMIADGIITKESAEKYFPELKEEIEDEKISKGLIAIIVSEFDCLYLQENYSLSKEDILSWLEKQGEQKPQIKLVFPKFRVGDIIQHIPLEKWDTTKKITHIDETGYHFDHSHQGDTVSGGFIGFSFEKDYELVEQKPSEWSEHQHKLLNYAISMTDDTEVKRFLESLRNAGSNTSVEWSEEDSKNMKECLIAVSMSEGHDREEKEQLEDWLKYHLSQKQCGYNPYKEVVESIAEMCEKYKLPTSDLSDFLDNVMVKCKEAKEYDVMFPQNNWKPSDEMLEALYRATPKCVMEKSEDEILLDKLYQGLKYGRVL